MSLLSLFPFVLHPALRGDNLRLFGCARNWQRQVYAKLPAHATRPAKQLVW
jgi:hypothetical protein